MSGFTHLHVHTQYSLLDGVCKPDKLLDKAKELGQTSVAITDHGVMYGAIEFYNEAKKRGIKPIIGCECYVAPRGRKDKIHALDSERYHLILLCKNNAGYQNLISMVSKSWTEGFYVKPRIDRELLQNHSDGLIALSGCLFGEIPRLIARGDYNTAKETALWYKNLFGDGNYYIEIQNHYIKEEKDILPELIRLSEETDIPLVATNDVHYIEKDDSYVQQVAICIQTNHVLGENTGLDFSSSEMYLKSEEEMLEAFSFAPDAVKNTGLIADKCNIEFEFGKIKLPFFHIPGCDNHFEYFRNKCYDGLKKKVGENPPKEYVERLEYELGVVDSMGYTDYYLIVSDYVDYAKKNNIPVGPGRGSGAGSLAAYCIDITEVDPMKYNLLFERFLNAERVSMPDFDVDFCYIRRDEVIDYVVNKYGSDHVAQIITFGTLAAKAAIRDVGRALGIPYNTVDIVAKAIPNEMKITISKALETSKELKALYLENSEVKKLIDTAQKLEGMPRHASTHAAGVVITEKPVSEYVPLAVNDNIVVTQYTMTTLESLGLLKMDFLGLRTLTVIDYAEKLVKKRNPDFNIKKIDINDKKVFEMLSRGETSAVFQYESSGMRSVLTRLKPESLEDMIAVVSLYRPGPADSIDVYIENRHHPEKIKYKTPMLKDIFDVTYGCMVYQEQVMQVCRKLAGYSYGRADIVRRAMSKKKADVMEKERHNFIYGLVNDDETVECDGCIKRGISEEVASEIFDEMTSFAKYAFNKSHAAAYALVAYQTAYLKCYYPCEIMAATLTSVLDRTEKVSEYIEECNRLNIPIKAPNVNTSYEGFTVKDGCIYYGLRAIKNIGKGFINSIVTERETNGEYSSFYSFCKRVYGKEFNRRACESLIKCGAFDTLGLNRHQMLMLLPEILSDLESDKNKRGQGQIGFFDTGTQYSASYEPVAPNVEEFSRNELLAMEKEMSGLYFSGHPMTEYKKLSEKLKADKISDLLGSDDNFENKYSDNQNVRILGIISSISKKSTKNNSTMAFLTVEDTSGSIECLVFSSIYERSAQFIQKGNIILIDGRLSLKEDSPASIVTNLIQPCPKNVVVNNNDEINSKKEKQKKKGLFLRLPSENFPNKEKVNNLLSIFDGTIPVYLYYNDKKEYKMLPLSMSVDGNPSLIRELKRIIGENNVVLQ